LNDAASLDVERLGAGRLAAGIERDLLDARLGQAQELFAAALERLAALVDCDRLFKRHFAFFEPSHDLFEFFDRLLEAQFCDIDVPVLGHGCYTESRVYFIEFTGWCRPR